MSTNQPRFQTVSHPDTNAILPAGSSIHTLTQQLLLPPLSRASSTSTHKCFCEISLSIQKVVVETSLKTYYHKLKKMAARRVLCLSTFDVRVPGIRIKGLVRHSSCCACKICAKSSFLLLIRSFGDFQLCATSRHSKT